MHIVLVTLCKKTKICFIMWFDITEDGISSILLISWVDHTLLCSEMEAWKQAPLLSLATGLKVN